MGQRSRKRGRHERPAQASGAGTVSAADEPRRRLSSVERDAAVRAQLKPLAPGERPWPITIGAFLALLTGGGQLALFVFGVKLKVAGGHPQAGSTIAFGVLMFICAIGMWTMRYQAVLAFMALLGILVLYFSLALIKASSLVGLAISLAGVVLGGWLFYKLVRTLSRIQMPQYPRR